MTKIGKYTFEGPYRSADYLKDLAGVYAILASNGFPIDIGESANVKTRIENHDRVDCWRRNGGGVLAVAVLYTPNHQQQGRMAIEQELRQLYNPPCGRR